MHGLLIWLGVTNPDGAAYLFWSGVGADLGYLAVPLLAVEYVRRNTCDVRGCRRLGRVKAKDRFGDTHSVCTRHAPRTGRQAKILAEDLAEVDERPLKP